MRTTQPHLCGTVVSAPADELDLAVVPELRALLTAVHRPGACVVLDLRRVTFMDSSALTVVLTTERWLHATGGRLRLANVTDEVRRVLRIVGLARLELPARTPRRPRHRCLVRRLEH